MYKFLCLSIFTYLCFSCSSELDFDQANDLKVEPALIANLASFDIKANQFIIGGLEQPVVGDLIPLDIFKEKFLRENLTKADFFFEFNNTINRGFIVTIAFLDDNNTLLYPISFTIPPYSGTTNLITKTEVFDNLKLDLLKNTSKVAFRIMLAPGTPLTSSSLGSLKLHSSATINLVIK